MNGKVSQLIAIVKGRIIRHISTRRVRLGNSLTSIFVGGRYLPLIVGLSLSTLAVSLWRELNLQKEQIQKKTPLPINYIETGFRQHGDQQFFHLSAFVLGGGFLIAFFVALAIYFAQKFYRRARQLELANQELQQEIRDRQQIEINLREREQQLRESEEGWQLALKGNNDGIWDWNIITNEVFFSTQWKAMLGYQDHEISQEFSEFFNRLHSEDRDRIIEAIQDHLHKKTTFSSIEHRLLCKDGTYKWILTRGQALWNENGNPIRMVGFHTDITENKRFEEELRWKETLLRSMANTSPLGFYVVDNRTDDILYFNHNFCTIWQLEHLEEPMKKGYFKHNNIISKCLELVSNEVEFLESFCHHENQKNDNIITEEIFFKQSKVLRVFSAKIKNNDSSEPNQFTCSRLYLFEDITHQKKVELALKLTDFALEKLAIPTMLIQKNGKILKTNEACSQKLGYSYEEVEKMSVYELDKNLTLDGWQAHWAILKRQRSLNFTSQILTKEGILLPVEITSNYLEFHGQEYVFSCARDLTADLQAKQQINESKEYMELILQASSDGFWDWNLQTGAIYLSSRWKEMIGYGDKELPNELSSWQKIIFKEDQDALMQLVNNREHSHNSRFIKTHKLYHKNGSVINVLARAIKINDQNGECIRMIGTHTDITQLIQTQEELRKSEERISALLNAMPDTMIRLRIDGTLLDYHGQKELLIPFKNNHVSGFLITEKIKEHLLIKLELAITTGQLQTYEYQLNSADGMHYYEARLVKSNADEAVCIIREMTQGIKTEEALRNSRKIIDKIADSTPNILYVYHLIERKIVYLNRATIDVLGYTKEEILAGGIEGLQRLIHPEDIAQFSEYLEQIMIGLDGNVFEFEYRMQSANGIWRNLISRDTIFTRTSEGVPEQILGTAIDMTESKMVHEELTNRLNEVKERNEEITLLSHMTHLLQAAISVDEAWLVISQLMPMLFPHNSGGVFRLNPVFNSLEGVIIWGTPSTTQELFLLDECLALQKGQPHLQEHKSNVLCCQHLISCPPAMSFCIPIANQGETIGLFYLGAGLKIYNLSQGDILLSQEQTIPKDKQQLAVTVARQISMGLANLTLRETLRHQSIRDSLTGLYNRRYLEESLEREIHLARRNKKTLGVIMLDVDHFKRFNDTFGHDAGDVVLRELGLFLQNNIRRSDIACRYGGEELTVILPGASLEQITVRAEQLRLGVKALKLVYQGQSLGNITLSLGVACFPQHGDSGKDVIQVADAALYQAKRQGRDRVVAAAN
jgi:diguanylate cyclase (GGDEF)-like protein/PAS domain S-box-containing protein